MEKKYLSANGNATERGNMQEARDDVMPNDVHVSIEFEKKTISDSDVNAVFLQASTGAGESVLKTELHMDTMTQDSQLPAGVIIDQIETEALNITTVSTDAMLRAVRNAGPRGLHNLSETFAFPTFTEAKQYAENWIQSLNATLAQRLIAIATNATVSMKQSVSQARHLANAALKRLVQEQVLGVNSSLRINVQKAMDSGDGVEVLWQMANQANLTVAKNAENIAQAFSTAIRYPIQQAIDDARNKSLNASMVVRELSTVFHQTIASDLDQATHVIFEQSAVPETLRNAIDLPKSLKAAALATGS